MTKTKKTPDFIGVFADLAIAFISYKQSIGFKYETETKVMSRFTKFADNLGITEATLDKDLVLAWIEKRPNEADKSREHRYSIIRQFALYLINLGHTAYIAPAIHYKGSKHFTPHIFTHDEMARVFENADIIPRAMFRRISIKSCR